MKALQSNHLTKRLGMGHNFHIILVPTVDVFSETQPKLMDHIINWGYLPSKVEYYKVLLAADVAVSTANHEFFGVAM